MEFWEAKAPRSDYPDWGGNDKVGGIRWETREPPVKYGRSHGRVP